MQTSTLDSTVSITTQGSSPLNFSKQSLEDSSMQTELVKGRLRSQSTSAVQRSTADGESLVKKSATFTSSAEKLSTITSVQEESLSSRRLPDDDKVNDNNQQQQTKLKYFAGFMSKLKLKPHRKTDLQVSSEANLTQAAGVQERKHSVQAISADQVNLPVPVNEDVQEAFELLSKLVNAKRTKTNWNSPLIEDELFLTDILFGGDATRYNIISPTTSTMSLQQSPNFSITSRKQQVNDSKGSSQERVVVDSKDTGIDVKLNTVSENHSSDQSYLSMQTVQKSQASVYTTMMDQTETQSFAPSMRASQESVAVNQNNVPVRKVQDEDRRHSIINSIKAPRMPKKSLTSNVNLPIQPLGSLKLSGKKFNSCSTLFALDNTLYKSSNKPDYLDMILKTVSYAVSSHLERTYSFYQVCAVYDSQKSKAAKQNKSNDSSRRNSVLSLNSFKTASSSPAQIRIPMTSNNQYNIGVRCFKSVDILSEKLNPIWNVRHIPDEVIRHPEIMQPPTQDELHHFLKQLFTAADLSAECGIITLIYLERLLKQTKIGLHGLNVFRTILISVMMASKIWDDQAVWNTDFKTIMKDLRLPSLNLMERWWLKTMKWQVGVKRALFASYWFEIRECAEKSWGSRVQKLWPNTPTYIKQRSPVEKVKSSASFERRSVHKNDSGSSVKDEDDFYSATSIAVAEVQKPLTEQYIDSISAVTSYSESKIRESYSYQLNLQLSAVSLSSSKFPLFGNDKVDEAPKKRQQSLDVGSHKVQHQVAKKPILKIEFGGVNLRRAKSANMFVPTGPQASVL